MLRHPNILQDVPPTNIYLLDRSCTGALPLDTSHAMLPPRTPILLRQSQSRENQSLIFMHICSGIVYKEEDINPLLAAKPLSRYLRLIIILTGRKPSQKTSRCSHDSSRGREALGSCPILPRDIPVRAFHELSPTHSPDPPQSRRPLS